MTAVAVVLAVAAGLLALTAWWVRRTNLAVYPVGRQPRHLQPLPVGCELGAQLLAATSTETRPSTGGAGGGGSGAGGPGRAPKRKGKEGPTRRTFLRTGLVSGALLSLGAFAGSSLAFLWPNLSGGFGAELDIDDEATILDYIRTNREPFPYPAGRMYLVAYDPALDPEGQYADITNGASVMALYQKCVHLGCKVPWCLPAQWFQCPCHGSNYNRWGEWQLGPAPRGLDRFSLRVENGRVLVDTSTVITGPSREAQVLSQPQEGPSCIS